MRHHMKFYAAAALTLLACGKSVGARATGGGGAAVPPMVSISSPTSGAVVGASAVQVVGAAQANTAISALSYELNGGAAVSIQITAAPTVAFGFTVSGLASGSNTIVITATSAGGTGSAQVSVTFGASEEAFTAPVAAALAVTAITENATAIMLAGSGGDGSPLTYALATQPQSGTLTGTAPMMSYRSATHYTGLDTFTYTVSDGSVTTAPATVTIAVVDGTILYADTANGDDSNSGRAADRAKKTVQAAIDAADSTYATVSVAAGVYAEYLAINKTLTVQGPGLTGALVQGSNEPEAVIQPPANALADFIAIVQVGDTTDAATSTPNVTLANLKIDGSQLGPSITPNGNTKFYGVATHAGSSATFSSDFFSSIRLADGYLGDQIGIAIHSVRGAVDIESSLFTEFDKQALTVDGSTTVSDPPTQVAVRNSHFIGTDPTAIGTQNSENGLVLWDDVVANVTGNLFENFGDSGASRSDVGGARVASDYSVGFAVLLVFSVTPSTSNVNVVTGNTFTQCQGAFIDLRIYDSSPALSVAIAAPQFLSSNTVTGGFFVPGAYAGGQLVLGTRATDPNYLNYAIAMAANWQGNTPIVAPRHRTRVRSQ